jgi:hypothetical protein
MKSLQRGLGDSVEEKRRAVTVLAVSNFSHLLRPLDQLFSKTNPLGAHFINQRADTGYHAPALAQDQQTQTADHQKAASLSRAEPWLQHEPLSLADALWVAE